jgi:type VI secretion system protein VasI
VTTRFGSKPAEIRSWNESTIGNATFFPGTSLAVIGFVNELLAAADAGDSFIARTTPYDENASTATFDLTGIEEAVKPLRETCGLYGLSGSQ